MIRIMLITALVLSSLGVQAQKEKEISSDIREVTVFQQGAEVIREAKSKIPAGNTRLVFSGITESLDPRSIQIDARGDFTIIAVSWRYDYLASDKREDAIKALEKRAHEIKREIRLQEARKQVLVNEKNMLMSNQSIGGQNEGLDIDDLKEAVSFFRERLSDIDSNYLAAEYRIESLQKEIGSLNMQLGTIEPQDDGAVCEILLDISSAKESEGAFFLRYLVADAGWTPVYDLRAISTAEPIKIDFKSRIRQNSGEDWKMAKIHLSTGDPMISHTKPEMTPWLLQASSGFRSPLSPSYDFKEESGQFGQFRDVSGTIVDASTNQPLPFASIILEGFENLGTISDMNGHFRLPNIPKEAVQLQVSFIGYQQMMVPINSNNLTIRLQQSGASLEEVLVSKPSGLQFLNRFSPKATDLEQAKPIRIQHRKQLTTMSYSLKDAFTIPSDNKEYTLAVASYDIDATYRFASVPRLDCDAFLMAEMKGWEEYNLLSGTINLYFEGKYIGRSFLQTEQTGDKLEVSLGRDAGIVVEREKLKDFSSRQLIGGSKKTEMTWKITVKNTKNHRVEVKLEDQIPVSKDERVSVNLEEASGASLNPDWGYLFWNLDLEPGEVKEILVKYSVRYPRDLSVQVF